MSGEGGRPVVEAWGARSGGHLVTAYADHDTMVEWARDLPGTVVPLIAADRLTDDALVEWLAEVLLVTPNDVRDDCTLLAPAVLAALRTHLEQTGADT